MFLFKADRMNVSYARLRTISMALGGSLTFVDEGETARKGKEVTIRIPAPFSVCRQLMVQLNKMQSFIVPIWVAVIKYGDRIVCVEPHPLRGLGTMTQEGINGTTTWEASAVREFARLNSTYIEGNKWWFDGRYVYQMRSDDAIRISADGMFYAVPADVIDLQYLHTPDQELSERSCIRFVASDGTTVDTPPIWLSVTDIGTSRVNQADISGALESGVTIRTSGEHVERMIDRMDTEFDVNVGWVLKAASDIGDKFGYTAIMSFKLAGLMQMLQTVNLVKLPKSVKMRQSGGIPFSHALAWTMSKIKRCHTLDQLMVVRALIKYLTGRGVFHSRTLSIGTMFKPGYSSTNVPRIVPKY